MNIFDNQIDKTLSMCLSNSWDKLEICQLYKQDRDGSI